MSSPLVVQFPLERELCSGRQVRTRLRCIQLFQHTLLGSALASQTHHTVFISPALICSSERDLVVALDLNMSYRVEHINPDPHRGLALAFKENVAIIELQGLLKFFSSERIRIKRQAKSTKFHHGIVLVEGS